MVRASRYRSDIQVFTTRDEACVLVLGRGLCGRLEAAFEVAPDQRGRGYGRVLARTARAIADSDRVCARVAPANTSSLRALLSAGYVPIGTKILMVASPDTRGPQPMEQVDCVIGELAATAPSPGHWATNRHSSRAGMRSITRRCVVAA